MCVYVQQFGAVPEMNIWHPQYDPLWLTLYQYEIPTIRDYMILFKPVLRNGDPKDCLEVGSTKEINKLSFPLVWNRTSCSDC